MRLTDLISSNGDGLTEFQYEMLKKKFPLFVQWDDGVPNFRDKPETKQEAINWIKNYRLVQQYEQDHNLTNLAKRLVITKLGQDPPTIVEYLIEKFNIKGNDL